MRQNDETPGAAGSLVLLTRNDLERLLRLCHRTIDRLVGKGQFPEPIRIGASYRWRLEDVRRYLEQAATAEQADADGRG